MSDRIDNDYEKRFFKPNNKITTAVYNDEFVEKENNRAGSYLGRRLYRCFDSDGQRFSKRRKISNIREERISPEGNSDYLTDNRLDVVKITGYSTNFFQEKTGEFPVKPIPTSPKDFYSSGRIDQTCVEENQIVRPPSNQGFSTSPLKSINSFPPKTPPRPRNITPPETPYGKGRNRVRKGALKRKRKKKIVNIFKCPIDDSRIIYNSLYIKGMKFEINSLNLNKLNLTKREYYYSNNIDDFSFYNLKDRKHIIIKQLLEKSCGPTCALMLVLDEVINSENLNNSIFENQKFFKGFFEKNLTNAKEVKELINKSNILKANFLKTKSKKEYFEKILEKLKSTKKICYSINYSS